MAVEQRYTEQMPFVGTKTHKALVEAVAEKGVSKAAVNRAGLDLLFGLNDGELPEGADFDALVERAEKAVRNRVPAAVEGAAV